MAATKKRRRFSREFKVEAVRLVCERGVTIAQAARDLDVHVNLLRLWVRAHREDPAHSFPGLGQQKPEAAGQQQMGHFRAARLNSERGIGADAVYPQSWRLCNGGAA